jgi:hypothetical protein
LDGELDVSAGAKRKRQSPFKVQPYEVRLPIVDRSDDDDDADADREDDR